MGILQGARDSIVGALVGFGVGGDTLRSVSEQLEQTEIELQRRSQEGLADLELSMDDVGWNQAGGYQGIWRFDRTMLKKAVALSRIMYLLNPLIKRAVTVQELYVWGSGCTITADDPLVEKVLNAFFDDEGNERVIGQGEEGWTQREREQRIDGNTFFALFTNRVTGAVRVRLLPYDNVDDIHYNPDDNKDPWYYERGAILDPEGDIGGMASTLSSGGERVLYPDILYNPRTRAKAYKGVRVDWGVRILHVRTGGLSSMKFGLPELYAGLNWATAYKRILENFATILAAYAKIAMKMTGLAGKRGVAAAKSKMGTSLAPGNRSETNPPGNTASWMALSGNVDIQPVKTAHSTTAPDEARALRSMVASAADLPEHFFGDSDVGNFATSETLDRPTELKMIGRQSMWRQVILRMARYVIERSALAPEGQLRQAGFVGRMDRDPFDNACQRVLVTAPATRSLDITVTFPNITERAVTDRVRSVVNAVTLGGRKAEGIIPNRKLVFKLIMDALGMRDAEKLAEKYYPKDVTQGFVDPADEQANHRIEADAKMVAAQASKKAAENPPKPARPVGEAAPPPPVPAPSPIPVPLVLAPPPSPPQKPTAVTVETKTKEVVGPKTVSVAKRDHAGRILEVAIEGYERTLVVSKNKETAVKPASEEIDGALGSNQ